MEDKETIFNVFYRDYKHQVSISSTNPEPLPAGRIVPLAEQLLTSEDNFLGIQDDHESVLQVYCGERQQIVLELLYPETTGCLQLKCSRERALNLLRNLPAVFTEALLPGAVYLG